MRRLRQEMSSPPQTSSYTALHQAGAIDFNSALDLVSKRGQFMQAAAEAYPSGMVSIIGLDEQKVVELCKAAANGAVLSPANFNSPGQIVVSGDLDACGRAAEMAKDFGAKGAVPLKVAGAFHSEFMAPAAKKLAEAIADVKMRQPVLPVISNVDAEPHDGAESIKEKLVRQVISPVRWEQSVRRMLDDGVERFYEIGPGRVLAGLMRRIERRAEVVSINSADALAKLAGKMAQ
jgi:[acyl-carrier-protein] S-malonyltransferase